MNTSVATVTDVDRARRAFVWVGLVAPLAIAAVSVALMLLWLPDLPDRITTHWGPNGPDGFAGPMLFVWMQIGLGLALPLLMTIPVLLLMSRAWGTTCRFLAALSLGTAAFLATASLGSLAMQRESADAGFGIGAVMGIAVGVAVALGVLGWLLQPRVVVSQAAGTDATTQLKLAPGSALHGSAPRRCRASASLCSRSRCCS